MAEIVRAIDTAGDYIRNDFERLRYSFIAAYKAWERAPMHEFQRNWEREEAWKAYIEVRDLWMSAVTPSFY